MRLCPLCSLLLALGACVEVEPPPGARVATDIPATAPPQLLRFDCELPGIAASFCECATTPAEWKSLRRRLGGAAASLSDAWCDFAADAVLAVATAAAPVQPGFRCAVAEEEGVLVLTVTQELVTAGAQRSWGLVVKLPRRKAQLAVVLRRNGPAAETAEQTLRVFPGL